MNEDILGLKISRGRAEITLNRPAQLNAINCDLAEALVEALSAIDRD
jgi:enoyl-CoA hydratase/carnithine racemase